MSKSLEVKEHQTHSGEEGVVWEGGGTGRAMGAAGVEKGPQGEIRLES